jgi:hypothetical protein
VHTKIIIVAVFPEFSNFPGNFPSFSLNKNIIRIITNIKKIYPNRSSRSHRKKHFKLFPNFPIFRSTFPICFFFLNLIRTITNIKKKELAKSVQAFSSDALNQEHYFILKFSNFLRNFLNFSFRKNLLRSIRKHLKKR